MRQILATCGFSLLELCLAMTLLAIMAVIAYPTYRECIVKQQQQAQRLSFVIARYSQ